MWINIYSTALLVISGVVLLLNTNLVPSYVANILVDMHGCLSYLGPVHFPVG
jgi:hypothetical protein